MGPVTHYQHSGKAPFGGILLTLTVGLIAAVLLGALYGFLVYWSPLVYINFFGMKHTTHLLKQLIQAQVILQPTGRSAQMYLGQTVVAQPATMYILVLILLLSATAGVSHFIYLFVTFI